MPKKHVSWKNYLSDLDALYRMAIDKENITAALKIKEIQIKAHQQQKNFDLDNLSDGELDRIIALIEEKSQTQSISSDILGYDE